MLFFFLLLFFPALCCAQFYKTPWEDVALPTTHVKTCRLSVPHDRLIFNVVAEYVEMPQTIFYSDEHHE